MSDEAILKELLKLRAENPERFNGLLKYCAARARGERSDPRYTVMVVAALAGAYLDYTGLHADKRQLEALFHDLPSLLWWAVTEDERRGAEWA